MQVTGMEEKTLNKVGYNVLYSRISRGLDIDGYLGQAMDIFCSSSALRETWLGY